MTLLSKQNHLRQAHWNRIRLNNPGKNWQRGFAWPSTSEALYSSYGSELVRAELGGT